MLGALMVASLMGGMPASGCTTAYQDVACGWNCVARYGQLECADWPGGACAAEFGRVECGPEAPAGWGAVSRDVEFKPAQCIGHAKNITCGWDCKTQFSEAKCASWPGGACIRHRDTVVCGPEPPAQWWTLYDRERNERPPPRAQCISRHDQVACGWNCVERYGKLACSNTPPLPRRR